MVKRAVAGILVLLLITVILASCPSDPEPAQEVPSWDIRVEGLSPNAQRLMKFLSDNYTKKIISGQMDTTWDENMDMIARVYTDTGKYPALKGFDMMELPYSWTNYGMQQINEAIAWWDGKIDEKAASKLLPNQPNVHGIVTFCWHWRTGSANQFYTDQTTFRIPWKNGQLDTESADFKNVIIADMDKAAALLQLFKDKDIPVLWRPLHEAAGGWFWWGASGAQPCIALWEYMYDYFTNTKKLDNLIWVWNGQNKDWFPNPETVDIVGYDVYAHQNPPYQPQNYDSQSALFFQTLEMVPAQNLMVALTENGTIPDPDNCERDNAMWSWFMTWNDGSGSTQGQTDSNNFWTGEYFNTNSHKKHVYNHELVITLDELPDLTKYPL